MRTLQLITGLGGIAAVLLFVWATKWIVETYPQFGLGMCFGGIIMVVLYGIAEHNGWRERRY